MTGSPVYPAPDRRQIDTAFTKGDDGLLDIGWHEGRMSDGRPFRAELWTQDQITILTFFFSTRGIEALTQDTLTALLVVEGSVAFREGVEPVVKAGRWTDPAGEEFWAVNIVVGTEERTDLAASVPVARYARGNTNSGFYPLP